MNRSSIPNILLRSIDCFYILLDKELSIKAANEDYLHVFPQQIFETGKKFLDCFNNKYHEKFIAGFTSLQQEKDLVWLVRAPIESEQNILDIKWNICTSLDDDNALQGFEIIGVVPAHSSKEREIRETEQDLTERKAHDNMLHDLNESLKKRAAELAESNAELEKFAYVTSHDLQEPLRMVTSFLQLLEKRCKDKLDNKAHEYISYAVDGAERMKRLILDLLEYSRVNSSKAELEDVNTNDVAEDLKNIYKNILLETKGCISTEKLPVVKGNKTQILQLFQNLISNALKYRTNAPPVIDISFKEEKLFYKFKIRDNGIGIDPRFFHKIFIIFQRLHNRDEYSGTGIGLAICKKIIDKHGGKIWVTSDPGNGSTFCFTLPKS